MSSNNPFIVLDTNILISAAILPNSSSAQVLLRALKDFQLVVSEATWNELQEVLAREKFNRYLSDEDRNEFLGLIIRSSHFVESNTIVTDCIDPKDNKFLSLAIDAPAPLIISGDSHLLVLHPYRGITIQTMSEFLREV